MADLHCLANPARFRRFSQRLLPSLALLVLYFVPFALLAYYLIKWREIATW